MSQDHRTLVLQLQADGDAIGRQHPGVARDGVERGVGRVPTVLAEHVFAPAFDPPVFTFHPGAQVAQRVGVYAEQRDVLRRRVRRVLAAADDRDGRGTIGHRAAEERADGFLGRELVLPVEAEIPLRSGQLCSRPPQTGSRE